MASPASPAPATSSASLPFTIIGCGLSGCMVSLLLSERHPNENIVMFEARSDFRQHKHHDHHDHGDDQLDEKLSNNQFQLGKLQNSIKRSINLALSERGMAALEKAKCSEEIRKIIIPMKARMVHTRDGTISEQTYGTKKQAINSVSRMELNKMLLDKLDTRTNVKIIFEAKVQRIEADGTILYSKKTNQEGEKNAQKTLRAKVIIGADGAFSKVRQALARIARIDVSVSYIEHGYKELTLPATAEGEFALKKPNGLHIWPRKEFMLIALPNRDKSFTCTLFAPFEGKDGLENVQTDEQIREYFQKYFPDVIPLIPNYIEEFKNSPNSPLPTVRAQPWHYKDKIVLIGDAAHGCVPFYGQGMNAAFEDALLFEEIYTQVDGDPAKLLPEFSRRRVEAGHALAELSLNNYVEMRAKTISPLFLAKQKIDKILHFLFPSVWIPLYTMVAFTRIPYNDALSRARRQDRILAAFAVSATAACTVAATCLIRPFLSKRLSIGTFSLA